MAMEGTIIRGVGGFYYVHDRVSRVYACRAVGIFRNRGEKPLVGDEVRFEILDETDLEGSVTEILPRRNALIRPAVANIDQAMLVFALQKPAPNWNLLDRFLVMMHRWEVPVILIFNKADLSDEEEQQRVQEIYRNAGCQVHCLSVSEGRGMEELHRLLHGRTTVLAGPSGVGKSSLLNTLCPDAAMATGEISKKIGRGRHTTRHSELFFLEEDTFLMDTPGFTSLNIFAEDLTELASCYPEFDAYREECRFLDCVHLGEPECGVKDAVREGKIPRIRYENYCQMAEELRNRRKY